MNPEDISTPIVLYIDVEKRTVKPAKYRPIIRFKGDNVRLNYTIWERLTLEGKLPLNPIRLFLSYTSKFEAVALIR